MRSLPNRSEKAKSEPFIAPILAEIKRHNDDFLTIHSSDFLNVDPEHGLSFTDVWKFIKLEKLTLYVEDEVYRIQDLSLLLGILQSIVNFYKRILI